MKSAERANARKTIPPMIVTMETRRENNISVTTPVNPHGRQREYSVKFKDIHFVIVLQKTRTKSYRF